MSMPPAPLTRRRPHTLALGLANAFGDRIRDGRIAVGDKLPTEAAIMVEFGVTWTVVREVISKLQASGLVDSGHGIAIFLVDIGDAVTFRIASEDLKSKIAGLGGVPRASTPAQFAEIVADNRATRRPSLNARSASTDRTAMASVTIDYQSGNVFRAGPAGSAPADALNRRPR